MRKFLFPLLPLVLCSSQAADTPRKSGGFFGFGAPPSDQISAGLFPESNEAPGSLSSGATRSETSRKSIEGIFRSGEPAKVEAVSYVIENGRRVERPVTSSAPAPPPVASPITVSAPATGDSRAADAPVLKALSAPVASPLPVATETGREKKKGFLGFGKRDATAQDNPVVTPVPVAGPIPAATPVTSAARPPAMASAPPEKPAPAPVKPQSAKPVEMANDVPVSGSGRADTPVFAGNKPEKTGWLPSLPFLNRHKNDSTPAVPLEAPAPLAATPVNPGDAKPAPAVASNPSGTRAPMESSTTTAATSSSPTTPTFEIRRDPDKPGEVKKDDETPREGGLLSPIAKIRPPRKEKEIDLSGAETIIADGEIVARDTPAMLASTPDSESSGPRQAPQIVNGVKTYSSWDDVNARSSSAADKIISRIR